MSDLLKMKVSDLRAKDSQELRVLAKEIRKSLAQTRLDIYTTAAANTDKTKKLKKSLAKVLTIAGEKTRLKD